MATANVTIAKIRKKTMDHVEEGLFSYILRIRLRTGGEIEFPLTPEKALELIALGIEIYDA